MKKDALNLNIYGIKCDNPNCNYKDETVPITDYDEWLNKPCPKCGYNLLTQEDYDNTKFLLKFTKLMNKILPKRNENDKISYMSVNMDGTGKMEFEDIKIE